MNASPICSFAAGALASLRFAALAWVMCGWPANAQAPAKAPAASAAPREPARPFQAGETLAYQASWNAALTAADVKISVVERRDFYGKPAWHFRAVASTLTPVRYLFTLDDQFDSYADAPALATRQFELYLREQRKVENHKLRFVGEGDPAPLDAVAVRLPRGAVDPLAALFVLRSNDWTRQAQVEMPVFDGKKLYVMRARLAGTAGEVETPAGEFACAKIEVRVFDYVGTPAAGSTSAVSRDASVAAPVRGAPASAPKPLAQQTAAPQRSATASHAGKERTDIRIALFLAQDAARTPVMIEAQLPFGAVRIALASSPR